MTLHLASVAQLLEWQGAIIAELARRAAPPAPPPMPVAPWEMMPSPTTYAPAPVLAPPAPAVDERDAEIARLKAQLAQPPAMLGGQMQRREVMPGVMTTARTDPDLAARFAQMPARADGVPPLAGSGKGEGMIELSSLG